MQLSAFTPSSISRDRSTRTSFVDLHNGFGPVASFCLRLQGTTMGLDIPKMISSAGPCTGVTLAPQPTRNFSLRLDFRLNRKVPWEVDPKVLMRRKRFCYPSTHFSSPSKERVYRWRGLFIPHRMIIPAGLCGQK